MKLFQDFLQILKKFGLVYYHRYYSLYPGTVTDNDDPDMRGRIKVELPTVLGEGREHSAWVEPHSLRIAGEDHGEFFPPYVDDIVDVWFEEGDLNFPFYQGGTFADDELPEDFQTNYPDTKGWVFKSGQKIVVDETEGSEQIRIVNTDKTQIVLDADTDGLYLLHHSGANIQITENGSIQLYAKDGSYIFLDAENNEISFHTKGGGVFSVSSSQVLSDESGKQIVSVGDKNVEINADGSVIISGGKSVQANCGAFSVDAKGAVKIANAVGSLEVGQTGTVDVKGPMVNVGMSGAHGIGLGDNIDSRLSALEMEWTTFITGYNTHTHPTTAPGAPTLLPIPPAVPFIAIPLPVASITCKVAD